MKLSTPAFATVISLAWGLTGIMARGQMFTVVTNGPVVTDRGLFSACAWADFDDDGKVDLFVGNLAWIFAQTDRLTVGGDLRQDRVGSFSQRR